MPQVYFNRIERLLNERNFTLQEPHTLAKAILKLSDFYIENPAATSPLHEAWAQAAYLAYFFPLNYARNAAVAEEGAKRWNFFSDVETVIDYGSGLGAAILAVREHHKPKKEFCVDTSDPALFLQKQLRENDSPQTETVYANHLPNLSQIVPEKTLGILSYVYTELDRLPGIFEECSSLMLLEPATREDGRRLLRLREDLIAKGFHAWAPCPHQGPCPLLHGSERDWCHDRIAWQAPDWWQAIEANLPMKNRTLTYSYLLLRKSPQPLAHTDRARLVGDMLIEKGKTRQLICRDSNRRFLSWFPQRLKAELQFDRGDWLQSADDLETKSDELRIKNSDQIKVLPLTEK